MGGKGEHMVFFTSRLIYWFCRGLCRSHPLKSSKAISLMRPFHTCLIDDVFVTVYIIKSMRLYADFLHNISPNQWEFHRHTTIIS